jgi:DNA modification methylase
MPLKASENILVFYKNPPTYNPQMRTGFKPYVCKSGRGSSNYGEQVQVITESNGERFPLNWVEFKYDKKKFHPTQKPLELGRYLVRTYTNPGDLVLDNTCGVGSFPLSAKLEGRNFIGIELDEKYCEIARKRLSEIQVCLQTE